MKKILVLFATLFVSVNIFAQDFDPAMMGAYMGMPPAGEYTEVEDEEEDLTSDIIVNIPLSDIKSYSKLETVGQGELLFGGIFLGTGAVLAVLPSLMNDDINKLIKDGMYMSAAAMAGVGIIYTTLGLTSWCKGTKKFKNIIIEYSPTELAFNF